MMMRTYRALFIILTVWIGAAALSEAAPITLVPTGAIWRYLDNGSNQGTNWVTASFNDTSWSSGPAELGYGDGDEATRVEDNATPGYNLPDTDRYITTYFRHRFVLANPQDVTDLHVQLLRDDGAVVYLNGREIFRSNMPQGPINYQTPASIAVGVPEESAWFTNTVDPLILVNGTNVIAVEIHQSGASSSDISFNLGLHGTLSSTNNSSPAVSITGPADQSVFGEPATINIQATASDSDGSVTNVAFYSNGTRLGDDTNSPYAFSWTGVPAGGYQLRAVATDNLGASSTSAPISITVTGQGPAVLVISNAVWKYLDTGTNPGVAWINPAFDDSTWNSGPAELGYGDSPEGRPEATVVSYGPNANAKYITTYFRHSFNVGNPSLFTYLTVRLMRDDGGIVYLNGTEVFRSNMPQGPVDYLTPALVAVGGAEESAFFSTTVNAALLLPGSNVLAVEIHQQSGGSSDISFALELLGNTGPLSNNLPTVTLTGPADQSTYNDPAIITLNAMAGDTDGSISKVEFFQTGTRLGEDTSSPYSFTWNNVPMGTYQLFAIATDNLGGKATSAVATVFVTASSAPTISSVAPAAGTVTMLTNITVHFSEPVDGVDALDLLVNGSPASGLSGSNAVYTFDFPQPPEGPVGISWAANHGIVDRESTPKAFDALAPGATWQYTLVDSIAPAVVKLKPAAGATLTELREVEVTFSEPVGGVQANDLLVNGAPATKVSGSLAGPYVFTFNQPSTSTVNVAWTSGHGIHDFAAVQNAFAGGSWSYTLNTNLIESAVVINEIMFHPSSERTDEEYIELLNTGTAPVNLNSWRLRGGISFTFPNVTLGPGGLLVVAANTASFSAKYPSVANVIGNWDGVLSNTGEEIELEDAAGQRVNRVEYADEGDWAVRIRSSLFPEGWTWADDADGGGKSLELMNPKLPNSSGQNWAASATLQGTPGAANSGAANNTAPLILDVKHFPFVPKSTDTVTITGQVRDETNGVTVTLFYRVATNASPPSFTLTPMFDDGAHGDGAAGDGFFGVVLPAQPDRTVIEFYVQAVDRSGNTRTWPAAARQSDGTSFAQTCNALYQVSDEVYTGRQPFYRIIMTEAERALLTALNQNNPQSNAEMNGALVTSDGVDTKVRYRIGIRHRGASSRGANPPNLRVSVPSENRLNGVTSFNLNTRYTHSQLAGSVLSRKAGVHSEEAIAVQVRENGVNLANSGFPMFGSYIHLEELDTDFGQNHFPLDPNGNVYRCSRPGGDLSYRGANGQTYIDNGYSKQSNVSENDWSDLVNLTFALNNTADSEYPAAARRVADVDEWTRYFAMMVLIGYNETSIGSDGAPDDFSMYRGVSDPRFLLLPHDHDTDLGSGDNPMPTTSPIFRATANAVVNRFLRHPDFAPLFYRELKRMSDTTFSSVEVGTLLDQALGDWVAPQTVTDMKNWAAARRTFVLSQIPLSLTVNSGLPVVSGYYQTTSPTISLNGLGNVIDTRFIRVNGLIAQWSPVGGAWSMTGVPVQPGINRITVQALDGTGQEVATTFIEVWYDDGNTANLSGTIASSIALAATAGPYLVSSNVTVNVGVTLTIEPGTTLYFAPGTSLTVNGRLLAEGTADQRIRFTHQPGTASTWGGIRFNNSLVENRITYADVEFAATADPIVATGSTLLVDHVVFSGTTRTVIELSNSSALIRNSVFPSIVDNETIHGNGMPASGYVIIEGNYFGTTTGYSDIIDFTGGKRPGPILQVLNNFFSGGSDDALDLDGTDAHIEGNIFQHIHQDAPRDSASHAIATDTGSEITVVRNVFYDNDHAVLLKNGAFLTAQNNTIVGSTIAAISFDETNRAVNPGRGAYLEGNILWGNAALFQNLYFNTPGKTNTDLTVHRSIMQGTNYPGIGNLNLNPSFVNDTNDFHLRAGSPAIGTGPNGLDMGAYVPQWVSISGGPASPTPLTTITLQVGGPGITHYRYRVNNGAYSGETSVSNSIVLSGLTNGIYTVFVIGKNSADVYQPQTNATPSKTWTVNTSAAGLRINEVLARNDTAVVVGSKFPDLIELYNAGPTSVDLTGMGITDDPNDPYKFTFPPGTTVGAGQYRVLYADNETTPPGLHLGFSLKQEGDEVLLFGPSGQLIDSVSFGSQVPDLSIGRLAGGVWGLTQPTFGSPNNAQRTGDPRDLRINEWLADGVTPYANDFIELLNLTSLPVPLGGLFLTDNPLGAANLHEIAPLSFIPANGFAVFTADGNAGEGPEHLNFRLSPEQGMIGLSAHDLSLIDCVIYGPQMTDVSQGRQSNPDGSVTLAFFNVPTPGSPNPGVVIPNQTVTINEVLAFNTTVTNAFGNSPDFIELYNPSGSTVDLSDMSLSDNPATARRFVFPAGSSIGALGYRVIQFDSDLPVSGTNTGFGLKQTGGAVYLFDRLANGGSLLSSVAYGLQAADFSISRVPNGGTNWVLSQITLGSANVALPALGDPMNLKINEWMASPASGDDWFEVYNPNAQPVALGGLYLTDDLTTRTKSRIPPLSFIGRGAYAYQRFEADDNTAAGADHVNFRLSAGGESLGIATTAGAPINEVTFGRQATGVSEGRLPDGASTIVSFPDTSTPGDANYLPLNNVVINEVLAHTDLPFEDAIELYNASAAAVNISGWYLSDSKNALQKFRIPTNTIIEPGGFKVFYEYQFNADPNSPLSFSLNSARGDEVHLSQAVTGALTGFRATARFGASENGVSIGRHVTSVGVDFVALSRRTFGADNPDTSDEFRMGNGLANAYPKVGPIVITEIMYHPPDNGTNDNVADEFIELRNLTSAAVSLFDPAFPTNTWRLRDAVRFDFPPSTYVAPNGELLIVSFDPVNDPGTLNAFRSKYSIGPGTPIFGPYSGKLDNGGESIELYKPDTPQTAPDPDAGFVPYILVERVKYSDTAPWPIAADGSGASLQRVSPDEYGNDPANWIAGNPTPGPVENDTDGDGMPDSWEQTYGLKPNDPADALEDADGDGITNLDEYLAGTNPRDAQSGLRLRISGQGSIVLEFNAVPNRSYTIEYSSGLETDNWIRLDDYPATPSGGPVQVTDVPSGGRRLYRLRTPQSP
jgi:hypothetical protein